MISASQRTPGPNGSAAAAALPRTRLRPPSRWPTVNLREVWRFRELLWTFAARDLKLRFKQTALGVAWVILQPLLAAGIFAFVFGRVAGMSSEGLPYFVFAYAGLLGWRLFGTTFTKSSGCLVENSHLISKIYFPRLLLPASTVVAVLVDVAVAGVVLVGLMFAYGVAPTPALLLLPVWIGCLLAFALGSGLIAGALAVQYRDVLHIRPVFVQMLLYASPVAYPVSEVPADVRAIYLLNPLAPLLEAFRWSVVATPAPQGSFLAYSVAASLAVLVAGSFYFRHKEREFADVV